MTSPNPFERSISFHSVETIDQVLELALEI